MQAITTKFIAPSNTLGSRVKATCWLKSKTVSWDHALNTENNHRDAITELVKQLNNDRLAKGNSGLWFVVAVGSSPDLKGYTAIIDLNY